MIFGVLVALFMVGDAIALDPSRTVLQYNCRTWRRPNGLPTNAVTAITQTADGHLWLGSSKGLVKFDGVEFQVLDLQGKDSTGAKIITGITRRSEGGVWLGLERGGLGYFAGEKVESLSLPALIGPFITTRTVRTARDGSLLIGFVNGSGRWRLGQPPERMTENLDVLSMFEDASGRIWMGTANNGLKYWEQGQLKTFPETPDLKWKDWVIHDVVVDSTGLLWVATSNGLECFNPDFSRKPVQGLPRLARTLMLDSHGVLWIGTIGEGLMRYHKGRVTTLREVDGLASNRILSLAESDDGSIWVGTEDGLSQLTDVKFPIASAADGLVAEVCLAVSASPNGGIWAGTSNGMSRIQDGKFSNFGYDKADGFQSRWIKRVLAARNGDVYVLGGQKNISRFVENRVVKTWMSEVWPRALAEDSKGILISLGNEIMRLQNDEIVPLLLADGRRFSTGYISELLVARDDSLWVASEGGIGQIKNGIWHDWTAGTPLAGQVFFYLCEDDQGAVWVARNTGLVRIKDGRLSSISHEQGLHENFVYAIVADRAGNFWMDSNKGIFRVSQAELNAVADGKLARLQCTVYEGQHAVKTTDKSAQEYSGCRSLDGRIWFPSSKGVIMIDPASVPMNPVPPRTYLKSVQVNGVRYAPDYASKWQPGPGNLEFEYYALDYQAPDRVAYRYRLEGYQSEWIEAGSRRLAYFTNLQPGAYRFHVQARNADGIWNSTGASYALVLPSFYYETWWFRGLVLGGLLLGGTMFWRNRERHRSRELRAIRAREELQQQLIESSPVAMMLLDDRHRVHHLNTTFRRLFGYSDQDVPDLDVWWCVACPEALRRGELMQAWKRLPSEANTPDRPADPLEATLTCKDGSKRTVLITSAEVGARSLVVFADITERKHAEESRMNLESQLRQAQKMEAVGRLSGGIAHDFNNLLTVVLGNISLLELEKDIPPAIAEPIAEIKESSRRAAKLTQQMLAFSRKQPMTLAVLDLNHLVTEMTRMLRRIVGEDVGMDIMVAPRPLTIRADSSMIEQVLLNLVINSRDAMPTGGRIVIEAQLVDLPETDPAPLPPAKAGQFALLRVMDTGSGIAPDVLPRIFEPFFTTKDVGKGTGLGLATVYGIVQQHGGWIDVASEVGRGTTFRVYVPYLAGDETRTKTRPAIPVESTAGNRLVLLVEDEDAVRDFVRRVLVKSGYRVLEAVSGPTALELWQERKAEIDVVLTDLVMPDGMSGIDLAKLLTGGKPGMRIIYSSGYSVEIAGETFPVKEGVNFLPKPYVIADLIRILQ